MKRMHIHIVVNQIAENINFYSTIFGEKPTIIRDDYAKWEVNEPAVNFAISSRGHINGINHLGIQVESEIELKEIAQRLDDAEIASSAQSGSSCCYAHSNKHWAMDPQGIAWESFHTLGVIPIFGEDTVSDNDEESSGCCIPLIKSDLDDKDAACCVPNESATGDCC